MNEYLPSLRRRGKRGGYKFNESESVTLAVFPQRKPTTPVLDYDRGRVGATFFNEISKYFFKRLIYSEHIK